MFLIPEEFEIRGPVIKGDAVSMVNLEVTIRKYPRGIGALRDRGQLVDVDIPLATVFVGPPPFVPVGAGLQSSEREAGHAESPPLPGSKLPDGDDPQLGTSGILFAKGQTKLPKLAKTNE